MVTRWVKYNHYQWAWEMLLLIDSKTIFANNIEILGKILLVIAYFVFNTVSQSKIFAKKLCFGLKDIGVLQAFPV